MKKIIFLLTACSLSISLTSLAQETASPNTSYPQPVTFTNEEDHENMQQQLGIRVLRPGPSGNENAPNAANYDETQANPCPELPDLLRTNNGREVTTRDQWWSLRRPELVESIESEIYGKLPENLPDVNWEVEFTDREWVGRIPVIAKKLKGHVDNSSYPLIEVSINMVTVVPANVDGPVPLLIMFGRPALPAPSQPSQEDMERLNRVFKEMMVARDTSLLEIFKKYPAYSPLTRLPGPDFSPPPPVGERPSTQQLLAAGWGYAILEPGSIQADNHAGITRGIIGLANQGQPRKPSDWGALRAWAWGAARALDYLETDPMVEAKKVGIEGVSRFGKAALVTMAFEPRFAIALIGSSGKGGVTLHRRVFGEAVESLAGGENYWMAGNYMKYGAEESDFGRKTGCDLPADAHQVLALCAPRPVFVSYGIPEAGDAKWLDQKGSFMATVAAGEAYTLLGARDLGLSHDYMEEEIPPVNQGLLNGELAWRQHDGGHTDWPNMQYFIPWANRMLDYTKKSP